MRPPSATAQWIDAEPRASHEESRELSLVREVSQLLAEQGDLRVAFKEIVQRLTAQSRLGMTGAMVFLAGERGEQADICVADGSTLLRPRGTAAPDAVSVAEEVVQRGRPAVVARIARASVARAAHSTAVAHELSLVAAPILLAGRGVGAVSVECAYESDRDLHQ